jgi:hypothetical protein
MYGLANWVINVVLALSKEILLHFKFTADLASKVDEALAPGEHWQDGIQYRRHKEGSGNPG